MRAKVWTAFIISDSPLFARGLERLLQQRHGVKVVGFTGTDEGALDQIKKLKPDVIIVDAGRAAPEPGLLLSRLLQEQREARVLRVSLQDNTAALYTGRSWTANAIEDLIEGVLEPTHPSEQRSRAAGARR
jgi:DNA-binding NarL/FixJ family response regulator